MKLRPYQTACVKAVFSDYVKGFNRLLLALPCGAGKTIIFSTILKQLSEMLGYIPCVLIIAQRTELEEQARDKIVQVWPEAKDALDKNILIMSNIMALNKIDTIKADVCIIDECHHGVSPTHMEVLKNLLFLSSPNKLLVGCTATPERPDKISLGNIFLKISYSVSIGEMIQQGYLTPVQAFRFSCITTTKDPAKDDLKFQNKNFIKNVYNAYKKYAYGKKTIIFANTVQSAKEIRDYFWDQGDFYTGYIEGDMPKAARKAMIESFHDGTIKTLVNCKILAEGFDDPAAEVCIIAKPCRSKIAYVQMVGRVMRLYPGKSIATVIDVTDNEHTLITSDSIEGLTCETCQVCGKYVTRNTITQCKKCKKSFCPKCGRIEKLLCKKCTTSGTCAQCGDVLYNIWHCTKCKLDYCQKHGGKIRIKPQIFQWVCFNCIPHQALVRQPMHKQKAQAGKNEKLYLFSSLPWIIKENGYYYSNKHLCLEVIRDEQWYWVSVNGVVSKQQYCLEYAFERLEKYIMSKNWQDKLPATARPATPAQKGFLRSRGIDPEGMTFEQAQKKLVSIKLKERRGNDCK